MDDYNFDQLSKIIGEPVQVSDKLGNKVELKITEVNKGSLDGDEWESFSVIYTSNENLSIPQGTYDFYHQAFDTKVLFLSPNSAFEYETVINRSKRNFRKNP